MSRPFFSIEQTYGGGGHRRDHAPRLSEPPRPSTLPPSVETVPPQLALAKPDAKQDVHGPDRQTPQVDEHISPCLSIGAEDEDYRQTESKLLSVVMAGRNDNYMGNFKYRITTCINYLARHLKDLGRLEDVEIVVTDWNSETPLAEVLPLSPEAVRICRFVYVPPKVARELHGPKRVFHHTLAPNVALRRARGKFIMALSADSLVPRDAVEALLRLLEGHISFPVSLDQCLLACRRMNVPWEIVQRELSPHDWDRYLLLNSGELEKDPWLPGLAACCAAFVMHRRIWHACRGYNEEMGHWGWSDVEHVLRVTQYYPLVELTGIGVSIFQMEHYERNRRSEPENSNPHYVSLTFEGNDEDWGLGDRSLEVQKAGGFKESRMELVPPEASKVIEANGGRRLVKAIGPLSPALEARVSEQNITSDEYINWLCWIVGGWLRPESGNVRAFDCAVRNMPAGGAIVEIGSFLGLSTNIIAYLTSKYQRDNPFFSCDPWDFEGTEERIGGYFDAGTREYREYAKKLFIMNTSIFSGERRPYTIEMHSNRFFDLWACNGRAEDVFGRKVALGGDISFAYIDGAHTYEATKADFLGVHRHLLPGGFVLFDDSAENSGHEGPIGVALEVLSNSEYELIFKTPNHFFRKKC